MVTRALLMTLKVFRAPTEGKLEYQFVTAFCRIPPLRKYVRILNKLGAVKFQIFAAVTMNIPVPCDVTPGSLVGNKVSEDPTASIFTEELHTY
jgi:hypothetical protein